MDATIRHKSGKYAGGMRRRYFPIAAALILAFALIGFSDNLFTNVGQPSNANPKFIVHGLFCLAWMLLFTVQANLARGNIRLHRALGMAGTVVALGVTLSTAYVFFTVWKGWDAMSVLGKANRLLLPGFALFVLLGILSRHRPDRHKRLLYIATLFMLEPILSRAFDPFMPLLGGLSEDQIDRAWWIFFILVWNAFFLSLFVYDRTVARRIHPVTASGYLLFCGIWAMVYVA